MPCLRALGVGPDQNAPVRAGAQLRDALAAHNIGRRALHDRGVQAVLVKVGGDLGLKRRSACEIDRFGPGSEGIHHDCG